MGWIGQRPSDHMLVGQLGSPIPSKWREVVVSRTLACGIEVAVERRGLAVYVFDGWPPGAVETKLTSGLRTTGMISEAAKPAVIWRLRVMNSHLTLLHASSMFLDSQSLPVTRIQAADLYGYVHPDEGTNSLWYRGIGAALPSSVTSADRHRIATVPIATFEMSLDWLERVIASNALIQFDLLNQAQAALGTHDYALAVVVGWTVCELRLRALVPDPSIRNAKRLINAASEHGLISRSVADRLHSVRDQRNSWVHSGGSGGEPNEATALEASTLAAELLRAVIPNLVVSTERGFLYL